jgi:hypothetical protein
MYQRVNQEEAKEYSEGTKEVNRMYQMVLTVFQEVNKWSIRRYQMIRQKVPKWQAESTRGVIRRSQNGRQKVQRLLSEGIKEVTRRYQRESPGPGSSTCS